ncbi:hypothetical protein MLD52_09425 [Puniceicoccaceae bacterium K14]|nr:hypothetical protein [Puniceicoccaceae bacterium K14]
MLSKKLKIVSISLTTILLAAGATTPLHAGKAKVKPTSSESSEKETKRLKVVVEELAYSVDELQIASKQALVAIGCKIKKEQPDFIEAKRPNKIGVAVGSGGEILKINFKIIDENNTEITVATKKTMAGYVGQRLWSEELLENIKTILSEKE